MRGFVFSGVLKAQAFINEGKYKMTRQRLVWFFNCNIEPKGKPQVILSRSRINQQKVENEAGYKT